MSLIERNFSRSAPTYDTSAAVQRQVAGELLNHIKENDIHDVLDLGCGTGYYTGLLAEKFPHARITAVDISGHMIAAARRRLTASTVKFIVSDAEEMMSTEKFDLITSNACVHWLNLDKALMKLRDNLSGGGAMIFSAFGPRTFHELNASLQSARPSAQISAACFYARPEMERLLRAHFANVMVQEQVFQRTFSSLKDLLDTIKYSGARGAGVGTLCTPGLLKRMEGYYLRTFKRITATFQVFYCRADQRI